MSRIHYPNKFKSGDQCLYSSPYRNGLVSKCVFIRYSKHHAVVQFENSDMEFFANDSYLTALKN